MEQYLPIINELLDIKDELYAKGLITPFGGNISVRCPDDPKKVIITPGSVYKKNLRPDQFLCVDLEGNILNESKYKTTSETPIHLTILRDRLDINAVIHTHPIYTTIFGIIDIEFLPITSDAVILGELPIVEWTRTGTAESGQVLSQAFSKGGLFAVIRNHGLVVGGPTLQFASGITTMIEDTCKALVISKNMGIAPKLLSQEDIDYIHMRRGQV
jgi:L-fuculose-phosphate aldolase